MTQWAVSVVVIVLVGSLEQAIALKPDDSPISQADVKTYYRVQERIDPSKGDLFRTLVTRYGQKPYYTPDQVQYPFGKRKSKDTVDYRLKPPQSGPVPPGAYSASETARILKVHAARTKNNENPEKALVTKFGRQDWYKASQIADVMDNGSQPAKLPEPFPPTNQPPGFRNVPNPLYNIKIRQSWADVLSSEDASVGSDAKAKIGDLVGASLSFARDFRKESDSWSAVGAVLYPFEWAREESRSIVPVDVMVVPSFSINRVTTSGEKSTTDEIYYRLGVFSQWEGWRGYLDKVILRGAPLYGTDLDHDARLPGYEVELEPSMQWIGSHSSGPNDSFFVKYCKIGYPNILIPKVPELPLQTDQSLLDYQLRVWLHAEGGDIERAGTQWQVVKGSFERVGPEIQLRANAPGLLRGVSFTGLFAYVPTLQGPGGHDSLFKLDLTFALYSNPALGEKISLNFDYTYGGLDLTKQKVDSFTAGLSFLY